MPSYSTPFVSSLVETRTAEVRPSTWLGTNVDMSAATRSYSALASRPQVALVAAAPAPVAPSCRFAAAVAVSPVTNQVTEHLISNIGHFVALFLKDTYTNPTGKYFERSPINFAHQAKTPTLSTCGVLDRCTPPEEAVQFHNALLENGVKSVLVTYPQEGHGVRKWPAIVDYAARLVAWFEEYMPAGAKPS